MAFTYGKPPVEFREAMEGSQDAALSRTAQEYKTIWKVRWEDAEAAKVALLGVTVAVPIVGALPDAQQGWWSRRLPHPHPKAPWLFATDIVRTEGRSPRGKDLDGSASYETAWLYTRYTKLNAAILPDADPAVTGGAPGAFPDESRLARFVRKRRRNATEYMLTRAGAWDWLDLPDDAPNKKVAMDIPWKLPRLRLQLTWMGVPIAHLNEGYINDTIGTTNDFAFGGFSRGSLLMNAADWPDWYPIPGQDGFQVDVVFDIMYFPSVPTGPNTFMANGPNYKPDPMRANTLREVGREIVPGVLVQPFPERAWGPMFWPVNLT